MPTPTSEAGPASQARLATPARRVIEFVALTGVYILAGKLSLLLAFEQSNASAVWPPAGIALAAILLLGTRVWPALLIGAFAVNVTTAGTLATSAIIALGNTAEALIGAHVIKRWAGGSAVFDNAANIFRFAAVCAAVSTPISATIGVTTLTLAGFSSPAHYSTIWTTWWLGDVTGDYVVAPFLIMWWSGSRVNWRPIQIAEALLLAGSFILVGLVVFGGYYPGVVKTYPLEFVCMPLLLWVAFRFNQRKTATAMVLLYAMALWGTLSGHGPFNSVSANASLVLLQAFTGVTAVTSLALAAVVAENRRAVAQLQHLAVTDSTTGLANYRRLVEVMDFEIQRATRTRKAFAVLFFDMDGLKLINDEHGHIVGSRALERVAEALRAICRQTDLPARFGGDEFAVVLPETTAAGALNVANRVSDRIRADDETPALSVSWGAAEYPRDGKTPAALLSLADRELYRAKTARGRPAPFDD